MFSTQSQVRADCFRRFSGTARDYTFKQDGEIVCVNSLASFIHELAAFAGAVDPVSKVCATEHYFV
jgi:hypothetical protein